MDPGKWPQCMSLAKAHAPGNYLERCRQDKQHMPTALYNWNEMATSTNHKDTEPCTSSLEGFQGDGDHPVDLIRLVVSTWITDPIRTTNKVTLL